MEPDARTIGLGVLAAFALVQTTRLWWRTASKRWSFARRRERGREGEIEAEALLERAGYQILGRQVRRVARYRVDGELHEATVVADLRVIRRGKVYVAEVKTGAKAPDPMHRGTRRQLLEYAHAFDVEGLLLVDADRRTIKRFEVASGEHGSSHWYWLAAGVAVGFALYSLLC